MNHQNLTFGELTDVLQQIEAFTLIFHSSKGERQAEKWITDKQVLRQFVHSIDILNTVPAYISAKAQHEGLLKTRDQKVYRFGLYEVDETHAGYMVVGGRAVPLLPAVREIIIRNFRLKEYSSLQEFVRTPQRLSSASDEEDYTDENNYPAPSEKMYEYTVIFYSDNSTSDHNEQFAKKYQQLYQQGLKKVLIYKATKPEQVGTIKSKIKSGKIARIIYSVHGLEAEFDTKYADGFNNPTSVGLFSKNTSPENFATHLVELAEVMQENATLLLLSCNTAGEIEYKKKIYRGAEILTTLATDANLTVYAANKKVYITVDVPEASIKDGSIYYARPNDKTVTAYGGTKFPISSSSLLQPAVDYSVAEEVAP